MLNKSYFPFYSKNSKHKQLVKTEPVSLDEFTSCSDLPMSRFIKVTVTGDLSHLGRCANPEALWQAIHSEYTELSGDASSSRGLELAKQIAFLTNKINITNSICYHLSVRGRVDELIRELQNMGYRLKYTDLEKDLQRTISLSKSDHVKLSAAKEQYAKLETGDKTTEFQWYQMLSAIAKHRQITSINPALITVVEYICMQKEYADYISFMNKGIKN